MNKQFKKELLLGFGIIFGGLIVVGATLFLLSQDIVLQADKVATVREGLAQRVLTLGALADLKKEAPQAAIYRAALDKILVPEDELLDFPRWLSGLASGRRAPIRFSFTGEQTPPQEKVPGSIGFSAELSGELANIIGFLEDIELRSPRFLSSLESFSFKGGGSNYDLTANGKVYFR